MSKMDNAKSRTLTLKKTFNAPVKIVWEAWTSPEHVIQWWAPKGMKINVSSTTSKLVANGNTPCPCQTGIYLYQKGQYLEIEPYKKIVTTADFKPMTEGVELHVFFEEDGDKTNFTFSVVHATEEYCKQQEKMGFYNGWGSAFDRMEALIKSQI